MIPSVEPTGLGTRMEASLISSKASSMRISSATRGKGTFSRLASMARRRSVGSISWWYSITATNMPGRNRDKNMPIRRTSRIKLASGTRT